MYSLKDFPRVKEFLDIHLTLRPEVCHELPKLVTDWHKAFGFETDRDGKPWVPITRKALAFKNFLENKRPIIRKNDLIAGTTTTKDIGVVVYPEGHGTMIWSELLTLPHRTLNPADISEETMKILHHEVFPYWANRNFKEWVREKYGRPLCQKIDERFAVYFNWKQATISHTIPDFPKIMRLGTRGMMEEIRSELASGVCDEEKTATLDAMILCLEGLTSYSKNLAKQALSDAGAQTNPARKKELHEACRNLLTGGGKPCPNPGRGSERHLDHLGGPPPGEHQCRALAGKARPVVPALLCSRHGKADHGCRAGCVHPARHRAHRVLLHALHRPSAAHP